MLLWRRLPCRYRVVLAILLLLAGVYLNAARVRVEPGSDWHRSPLNDHWYALTPRAVGWSNARSLARRMGGDLVIIRSSLENQWVAETLLDFETFGAFLGLREVSHEGNWRWVDDSVPTYCNWYLGEPNNDSKGPHDVAMMYGIWDHPLGSWNDTVPGHEPKYLGPTALVTIGIGERKLPPGNLGYLLPALLCGVCALLILFNVLLVLRARRRLRRQAPQLFELIPR